MTAVGRARAISLIAWVGSMVLSAVIASSTMAFWFGGIFRDVENHGGEIESLKGRSDAMSETINRYARINAQTYVTKAEARLDRGETNTRLERIEDKLDRIGERWFGSGRR